MPKQPPVTHASQQPDLFADELSPDDQSKPSASGDGSTIHLYKKDRRWIIEVRNGKARNEVFSSGQRKDAMREYINWK